MNFVDISHNNGQIDFSTVKNSVDKIYMKCTQGTTFVDPMVLKNATAAKQNGIQIGFYHFATLNSTNIVQDAKAEAQFFISNLKKLPQSDLAPVLDIEENPSNLSKDNVLLWIKTFFYELAQAGYTDYVLYSYSPFLDSNLPINHGLGTIKLWVAAYTNTLKLPKGWSKYHLWQYSNKGHINGIKTTVDLNK